MQQWLFVSSSGQQFTAHEPDVAALVQSGQITAPTLMWREGMPQWMPAASVFPSLFTTSATTTQPMVSGPVAPGGGDTAAAVGRTTAQNSVGGSGGLSDAAVRRLAAPMFQKKGWIKFLGVMMILGGIFALPAFLLGLLPIFSGIALFKLAGNLEKAQAGGDGSELEEAQRNAAKFFYLQGILIALYLAMTVLVLGAVMLGSGAAILSGMKEMKNAAPPSEDGPRGIEDIRFPDSPAPRQPAR